jgi:hypothetical protein
MINSSVPGKPDRCSPVDVIASVNTSSIMGTVIRPDY